MPRVKLFDEQEVLQKAMLLFWQQGYYATSVQDLVNYLGINRGSLYATFGGKKQLFDAAFTLYRTIYRERLTAMINGTGEVKGGLRNLFTSVIQDDAADESCKGCFIVNTTTELVPMDANLQEVVREHRQLTEKIFTDFFQRGIEQGDLSADKDPVLLASLVYTFMTGLRVIGKTKQRPEVSLRAVASFLTLLD